VLQNLLPVDITLSTQIRRGRCGTSPKAA